MNRAIAPVHVTLLSPLFTLVGLLAAESKFQHPFIAFPQGGRGGESTVLPSEGTEHGVSSELLTGDPSGRPSPIR
jgi:hypothetical protein